MQAVQKPTPTGKLWFSGRPATCPATARRCKSTSEPPLLQAHSFTLPPLSTRRTCMSPACSTIRVDQCTKLTDAWLCITLVYCCLLQSCVTSVYSLADALAWLGWNACRLSNDFREATRVVSQALPSNIPAGHVLLRLAFAGVNASDVNFSSGRYHASIEQAQASLPFDAGFEAVGAVAAVGPQVSGTPHAPLPESCLLACGNMRCRLKSGVSHHC